MHLKITLFLAVLISIVGCSTKLKTVGSDKEVGSNASHKEQVLAFREDLNSEYLDLSKSPLTQDQIDLFDKNGGHEFFQIDSTYRIVAEFDTENIERNIKFETTTDRVAIYDLYGVAKFELNGRNYEVNVYQSPMLRKMKEYRNHLFLPFTDLTNGNETYGGGRYVDLTIPTGNKIILDFNKAYNPYCAYSSKYSCPIPPKENHIECDIRAGIRYSESSK